MSNLGEKNPEKSAIERLLLDAREKLVETGTRNRLVHVNRINSRANALNIINERSDDIFSILKSNGRKMKFLATGTDPKKSNDDEPDLTIVEIDSDEPFDKARYTDNKLETKLGPNGLQKRLLQLFLNANTAKEEQGINILYLVLGFLNWRESKDSSIERESPIILVPVELTRNTKTSSYDIKVLDDDIVTNLPLKRRLAEDFGIELPEISDNLDDWTPSQYFEQISEVIESHPDWSIDADGMQLGFFSFAKLLMLRDLDPINWPDGELAKSGLIEKLLKTGFPEENDYFDEKTPLDEILTPNDIIQVTDADASQTKVIEEVRAGRNLVVQGPPGTGKSQTITNIIAAAVHDGKSVLFVAEKMAALTVVHSRLKKVGLENICLELHSKAANKKQVHNRLKETLLAGRSIPDLPTEPEELLLHRNKLNTIDSLLHAPILDTGETPFSVISQMVKLKGQNVPAPTLVSEVLTKITKNQHETIEACLDDYEELSTGTGPRMDHPFYGAQNLSLQPTEIERISTNAELVLKQIRLLITTVSEFEPFFGMKIDSISKVKIFVDLLNLLSKAPEKSGQFISNSIMPNEQLILALHSAIKWQETVDNNNTFIEFAWTIPVDHLRRELVKGGNSFFARVGSGYRGASNELASLLAIKLPKKAKDRLEILDNLISAQIIYKNYAELEQLLQKTLGVHWLGLKTQFTHIYKSIAWQEDIEAFGWKLPLEILQVFATDPQEAQSIANKITNNLEPVIKGIEKVESQFELEPIAAYNAKDFHYASMDTLEKVFSGFSAKSELYSEWVQLSLKISEINSFGLPELMTRISDSSQTVSQVKNELRYARADAIWNLARQLEVEIEKIGYLPRHKIVEKFQHGEHNRILDVRNLIKATHLKQLPNGAFGEMAVIRGQLGKKSRHMSLRKLMTQAGSMMQKIKPVFLMSPMSIAQYLPPGKLRFDILVIDEASQVRPEDALGAIARCDQIVIVGDPEQLPPTGFFARMTGDIEEDDELDEVLDGATRATEMESILTLCSARNLPLRMLEWHYRSRDPSLIEISNREFYRNELILPPSPLQNDNNFGLKFTRVNGVYSNKSRGRGTPGTNKIEAEAVVAEISRHARESPELSLGVVAFSMTQRNMITQIIETERRSNTELEKFLRSGYAEDVFVKNIENVQGDERDVILISVGYGPNEPNGRLSSMNFGPVNQEGGARRLNVLFSRARIRCEVFASFEPGDIDLSKSQKEGTRIFKRYLEFAKSGNLDQAIPSGGLADSPFEEDVADEIRKLNYSVDYQIGSAGFLIDLGVKHPDHAGQYMLAVECDGATYHSALWARERDRLRQNILEGLGWKFHRIWSTDWFYRRNQEIDRLRVALHEAAVEGRNGIKIEGTNKDSITISEADESLEENITIEVPETPRIEAEPYLIAKVNATGSSEPHLAHRILLLKIVRKIIEIEGPVHQDEVSRRLASAFGKEKAGRRINEITLNTLKSTTRFSQDIAEENMIICDGQFWLTKGQKQNPPIRNRTGQSTSIQKAENIPPIEIDAAISKIQESSGFVYPDELTKAVATLFGFDRVGPGLKVVISRRIDIGNSLSKF
ncbi:MAG: DUF3320 domain-containing protein [Rhizobiales bacterium]|nr:DUF3320 domain-containing protein [Hyphomicrobiales bacterium]NRB15829.1 DUF3320 domain-containing protein [Hyphomicrobiales bacterium]